MLQPATLRKYEKVNALMANGMSQVKALRKAGMYSGHYHNVKVSLTRRSPKPAPETNGHGDFGAIISALEQKQQRIGAAIAARRDLE